MAKEQQPIDNENQEDEVDALFKEVMNSEPAAPAETEQPKTKKKAELSDEDLEDDEEDFYVAEHRRKARIRAIRRQRSKKSRGLSCTLILLTLIFAAAILSSVAILAVAKEMYGIDKDISKRTISIKQGSTVAEIANQLEKEKLIRLPKLFQAFSRLSGADASYIAGEHELSPSMSYEAMIAELTTNHADKREYVDVTFREGITLTAAAKILEENDVCDADKFIFSFNARGYNYQFENYLPENSPLKYQRMEGYCFPDTYRFYVNEDPETVARKIYENFNNKITAADYKQMDNIGMTLDEVITLASMVQAEANSTASMKLVSSVFHNRLSRPGEYPSLESDPTRKYAEAIADALDIPNPLMVEAYNTYKGTGLPPGAINNPGKDAINAVLYPTTTNYLFFCANVDTKEIFYAEDYATHKQNLAKAGLHE